MLKLRKEGKVVFKEFVHIIRLLFTNSVVTVNITGKAKKKSHKLEGNFEPEMAYVLFVCF